MNVTSRPLRVLPNVMLRRATLLLPGLLLFACTAASTMLGARAASAAPRSALDECLAASMEGQTKRDEGRYVAARAALNRCNSETCPAVVRKNCEKWRGEVEAMLPTLVFVAQEAGEGGTVVSAADVAVWMDGEPLQPRLTGTPVAVDPGEHTFVFRDGARTVELKTLVVAGEKNRLLSVRLPPRAATSASPSPGVSASTSSNRESATPSPLAAPPTDSAPARSVPAASVALGIVGALGIGTFTYLGLTASADLRALERSDCAKTRTCPESETDSVRARYLGADVALGVGVVALGIATWLWLRGGPPATPPSRTAHAPNGVPFSFR